MKSYLHNILPEEEDSYSLLIHFMEKIQEETIRYTNKQDIVVLNNQKYIYFIFNNFI